MVCHLDEVMELSGRIYNLEVRSQLRADDMAKQPYYKLPVLSE